MSEGFGADFKEQVRANTSLVELVSESVALTPRGSSDYVGLCPFHPDRNPSFHVYPERQSYRCWVCQVGGDCFTWVQETQAVSFPEAVEILAKRANLELPKRTRSQAARNHENNKAIQYEIVEWAIGLMQQSLRLGDAGQIARNYLSGRKLSDETIRKFRLGYHPEDWNWFLNKARGKYSEKQLLSVGLIGEKQSGMGYYDNLVGRVVFPILDERSRPVAFGGRVLPGSNIESPAKYWNSPESSVFLKRRTLYAFDLARDAIRSSKAAIVVEGYMDCIACHQAGVTNVVATLGTAMTEDHVAFLKRFSQRVVLIYDGDEAGQRAAERSIERFLAHDLDLRILTLADGQDPADYLERHGKEEFESLIDSAQEAWEYKLQSLKRRYDLDSVSGRQQILQQMLQMLASAPGLQGTVREDLIIRKLCWKIQVDEMTLRQTLAEQRRQKSRTAFRRVSEDTALSEASAPVQPKTREDHAEREILEIILSCPEHTDYIRHHIGVDDFRIDQHRRLLEMCFDLVAEAGELPEIHRVVEAAESDSGLIGLINTLFDSAREKELPKLMTEQLPGDGNGGGIPVPLHLERVLHPLLQRREKVQILLSKQKMAQTNPSASDMNSDTRDALRRITSVRKTQPGNDVPRFK
ncbi:MAG: DNA primase [Planctomycetaceae bacterium]